MTDVVEVAVQEWLVIESPATAEIVEIPLPAVEVIEVAEQGPMGPPGMPGPAGGSAMNFTATTAIGGHRLLALNAANQVVYASNDSLGTAQKIIGISLNAAIPGGLLNVMRSGEVIESSWNWITTLPVYLGVNGLLTQTPPASPAAYSLIVGFPTSETGLFLSVREPIFIN